MRNILIIIIVTLISMGTFFLFADSPVLVLEEQNSQYSAVSTWMVNKNPVPLKLNRADDARSQVQLGNEITEKDPKTMLSYITQKSGSFYGKILHTQNNIDVTWYDDQNSVYGLFSEEWPHDMPLPMYHIMQNPDYLVSVDFSNRIRVISRQGNEEKTIQLFADVVFNTENATFCDFTDQKEQIIIAFRQVIPVDDTRQGYNSYVTLVDLDGTEYFNLDFPGWQINGVTAADNAIFFIVALHKYDPDDNTFFFRTVILDEKGAIISDLPLQYNRAVFNGDGSRVLFYKNEQAWLYDIRQKSLLGEFNPKSDRNIFMHGLFIDDRNILILQDGEVFREPDNWIYQNMALQVFDAAGEQLQSLDLEDLSVYKPSLHYDTDSHQLFLGHSRGWLKYTINR
jgi:hypothetical protein